MTKTYGWLEDPSGNVVTPEAFFDLFSTARSAPAATYYVGPTGNDGTGNGTSGSPWRGINKAILAGNALGQPYAIIAAAGEYSRLIDAAANTSTTPTQDAALLVTGGTLTMGSWDDFAAPSLDATQTNCYAWAVTNVDCVLNRKAVDRFGKLREFQYFSTPALLNAAGAVDGWAASGGQIYVRRADGAAVTNANTRVLRQDASVFHNGARNFFIGGLTDADKVVIQGGSGNACVDVQTNSPSATPHVFVGKNTYAQYAGGITGTGARGWSFESMNGVAALWGCGATGAATDGFNIHNTNGAASTLLMMFGSYGVDNGRGSATSCNGLTAHENANLIDVSGYYDNNRGGTFRSINASLNFLAGTFIRNDLGDIFQGGSIPPTAIRVDDTAKAWLDGVRVEMGPDGYGLVAFSAGSAIYARNHQLGNLPSGGAGTIGAY